MQYRIVVKRRPLNGQGIRITQYHRPYGNAYSEEDARKQFEQARREYEDAEEVVIVRGHTWDEVEGEYRAYTEGRAFCHFDPTPDGARKAIEMAPLRPDAAYADPPDLRPFRFELFRRDEARGFIRLMRRVMAGELGGPDDGKEAN